MSNLPEGLTLTFLDGINFEPAIMDAQDVVWVHFPDHDTEDPAEWFANIIRATCSALGVTEAVDEVGAYASVEEFITLWAGSHESAPGSGFTA